MAIIGLLGVYAGFSATTGFQSQIPLGKIPAVPGGAPGEPGLGIGAAICINRDFLSKFLGFVEKCTPSLNGELEQPSQGTVSTGDILTISLSVAGIFLGVGLLAGAGGAGQLAHIISAVGIGVAFIIGTHFIISNSFSGVPIIIMGSIDGLFLTMYSYMIIRLLK